MPKAILELPEMPENCKECLLHSWESDGHTLTSICKILLVTKGVMTVRLPHKRRDDCPLKPENAGLMIVDKQTEQMKYLLRRTLPILEVRNDQQELIDAINALLGG